MGSRTRGGWVSLFDAPSGPRYEAMARVLLESPDPVQAIASLIGDHEARLDILAERLRRIEFSISSGGGSGS